MDAVKPETPVSGGDGEPGWAERTLAPAQATNGASERRPSPCGRPSGRRFVRNYGTGRTKYERPCR